MKGAQEVITSQSWHSLETGCRPGWLEGSAPITSWYKRHLLTRVYGSAIGNYDLLKSFNIIRVIELLSTLVTQYCWGN